VVLLVSGLSAVVLGGVVATLPVPYVVFSPGPVRDTLGTTAEGEDLIVVDGAETFPTEGQLDLTTIRVAGGPLGRVTVLDAIQAYVDGSRSLRPVETVYPPEETREQAREVSTAQMVAAQQSAAVAALCWAETIWAVEASRACSRVSSGGYTVSTGRSEREPST